MDTQKETPKGFDLVVHHRDNKTGRVTRKTPYRLFIKDGVEFFERPKGSGNLWYKNGEVAGRHIDGKFDTKAAHKTWVPPLTSDEALAQQHAAQAEEVRKLQAELNEIKREQKYKSSGDVKKAFGKAEAKTKED